MRLRAVARTVVPQSVQPSLKGWYSFVRTQERTVQRYLRQRQYAGDVVACPFCDKTFSRFRPTGALERPFWQSAEGRALLNLPHINVANALCPNCGSGERQRLLYFYLRDRVRLFGVRGINLLDVAPDEFLYDKVFSRTQIEYISIDISPARRPTLITSVTNLAIPECSFDAMICYHVLEHILDDVKAMQELYRVLKPGGWAILQVPIWAEKTVEDPTVPKERYAAVYGHPDHVRRYGLDYQERLVSAGFKVCLDDYVRRLPPDFIRRYSLFRTEDIYLCEKA